RAGRPLSSRDIAEIVGCSPTTAWRATRAVKRAQTSGAASPNGAGPPAGGTSTGTDALVEAGPTGMGEAKTRAQLTSGAGRRDALDSSGSPGSGLAAGTNPITHS